MAATYRKRRRPAAPEPGLLRWGPWQDGLALLGHVPEVVGSTVAIVGDVRSGGLAAFAAGAARVRADLATPGGAALALSHAACRALPGASAAALFGEDAFGRRIWFYHHIRGDLAPEARRFWDARERAIRLGLCAAGDFERRLARVAGIWRLGVGQNRARVQAHAVSRAWGRGADVRAEGLTKRSAWRTALARGRAPGLTVALHGGAKTGELAAGLGPADVVWLGDRLDVDPEPSWTALAPIAVGWTARKGTPVVPAGWQLEPVEVVDDSPLVRGAFVLRRTGG